MKDEAKVRRVVAALFKPLESSGERIELLEAVDSLLDIDREWSWGPREASHKKRAEEAEAALAVREAELATVREDLRLFQSSIDLRTPEDHFEIKKYDEAMRQLATRETRVGTEVAARLQEVVEGKDRELAALRRTRVQVEEVASQLSLMEESLTRERGEVSQLLIRG